MSTKLSHSNIGEIKVSTKLGQIQIQIQSGRSARIRANLETHICTIGPNDLIIVACALANEAVLVTSKVGEFKRIDGLRLEEWTELDV